MSISKRTELLKAMDLLSRSCNDEELVNDWPSFGIADGDAANSELLESYTSDEDFRYIMNTFLDVMCDGTKSGLYYDGVLSGKC